VGRKATLEEADEIPQSIKNELIKVAWGAFDRSIETE
jgi:hypothetical protein